MLPVLALVLTAPVSAGRPFPPISLRSAEAPEPTPAERAAEGRRLSEEISRAGASGNWKSVERNYGAATAAQAPLTAGAHVLAAEAARTRGDLGGVRDRLAAALAVDPSHSEARAALGDLDARFGRVSLKAPVGAKLEDYEHPFDPLAVRAVDFAIAELGATGTFRGLLPPGPYSVDGDPFDVEVGKEVVLDLGTTAAIPRDPSLTTGRR